MTEAVNYRSDRDMLTGDLLHWGAEHLVIPAFAGMTLGGSELIRSDLDFVK